MMAFEFNFIVFSCQAVRLLSRGHFCLSGAFEWSLQNDIDLVVRSPGTY
jgi:hypothetical protein